MAAAVVSLLAGAVEAMRTWLQKKSKAVRKWWDGEYKTIDDPYIFGVYLERSIWASRLDEFFQFIRANGWNVTFLTIGLLGLWLAYLAV